MYMHRAKLLQGKTFMSTDTGCQSTNFPVGCVAMLVYTQRCFARSASIPISQARSVGRALAEIVHKLMMLCHCRVAVSLQMVEEYDSFCKDFRKAVHENQDQGNLDLGNCTWTYLTA